MENIDKEEKIDEEEKMEVGEEKGEIKEEKINEEQKSEVKKQCTSLYKKYKRKREVDEDAEYFQHA
jgi:hypothetical protein